MRKTRKFIIYGSFLFYQGLAEGPVKRFQIYTTFANGLIKVGQLSKSHENSFFNFTCLFIDHHWCRHKSHRPSVHQATHKSLSILFLILTRHETSWDIKDEANTIIASGTINNDTLCYPTGNLLHFTIYDSYGDGICCAYGNGSYNVYIDGNLVASGGAFTFNETTYFNYPPGYISTTLINAYQQLTESL